MRSSMAAVIAAGGFGLFAMGLVAATPQTARAATVFDFSGQCSDCFGQGNGVLTLSQTPDGPLTKADFVSFIYKSNLLSFSLTSADIVAVMGSLTPNNLGKTYIDIIQLGGTGWEFTRNADGTWSVSDNITHGMGTGKGGGGGGGFGGGFGGGGGGSSGPTFDDTGSPGGDVGNVPPPDPPRVVQDFGLASSLVVAHVPEPASWTLMIVGFGALGGLIRRRRPALIESTRA